MPPIRRRHRAKRRGYYTAKPELHREVARKAHRAVMERAPESFRARVRKRWAQEKGAEGSCSASEWQEILDFYGNKCLHCSAPANDSVLTQDHIIPVSKEGSSWPENLQPLCRPCNSAKGARNSIDYRPDKGAHFAREGERPDHDDQSFVAVIVTRDRDAAAKELAPAACFPSCEPESVASSRAPDTGGKDP